MAERTWLDGRSISEEEVRPMVNAIRPAVEEQGRAGGDLAG